MKLYVKTTKPKDKCFAFNRGFPVGSICKLLLDSGEIKEVTVKHEATLLGGHTAVGWFEEITGCYDLDRVVDENNKTKPL